MSGDVSDERYSPQDGPQDISNIIFESSDPPDIDPDKSCNVDPGVNALPVVQFREQLVALIRQNQAVIVAGETGSGKTTQIPQFLLREGLLAPNKRLAVTQPRRLAAMAVAERVAKETESVLGQKVGYSVRFDDKTSAETEVRFLPDGLLLREFLFDPMLSNYTAVMIDEAHERTTQTDIVLGLVREVMHQRPEFKVIISSATLNAAKFARFFGNAPVFNVPGRRFPVQMFYAKRSEPEYIDAAVATIMQIHLSQPLGGDILVFLPGQEEIEAAEDRLNELSVDIAAASPELIALPLYANLRADQQARIFNSTPQNCRKVILATNIAETSLTIPGISYVVDSGLVKEQHYNSRSNIDSLIVQKCSQASANQRAGRAGRTGPGKCFRLYTHHTFSHEMSSETPPEILRTNLASVVLLLLTLGVTNVPEFGFLDPPAHEAVAAALTELYALGAITPLSALTKRGRILAEFPTSPQMARALLSSIEYGCVESMSTVVAMLGELGGLYIRPKGRKADADAAHARLSVPDGDQQTLLQIYDRWSRAHYSAQWCRDNFIQIKALRRARDVRGQLQRLCLRTAKRLRLAETPQTAQADGLEKALVSGFFTRCARLSKTGQHFVVVGQSQPVYIHPSSVIWGADPPPSLLLYHELVLTSREYMRGCMRISPQLIQSIVPHFYRQWLEKQEHN